VCPSLRLLSGILEHAYFAREGKGDANAIANGVLSLSPVVAPYKCCLLPLDNRIKVHASYISQKVRTL
jgi:glycyl-tRNA synthetase (class II)